MTEGKKMSGGAKAGIVVAVIVVIALVVGLILWLRSKKSDDAGRTDPDPTPEPKPDPPAPGPIVVIVPDPMKATAAYVKGQYHIVQTNDSDVKIVTKASFSSSQIGKARRVMRDHPLNAWLPQKADDPSTSYNEAALNLFAGWAKMAGYESLSWSWKTKKLGYGGYNWPVVYIPTDAEVQQ
ncbi:MAG: hypothetical protein M0R37_12505 [Bacteroidales bacterium]|jgi:hypothetical protein|nr:hypothetical protein [Bacteroidales bacterium]